MSKTVDSPEYIEKDSSELVLSKGEEIRGNEVVSSMGRKMKDSGIEWIGKIPEDWRVVPHKYIMSKIKNLCKEYNGEDILSLTMRGVIKRDLDNPSGKMPASFDGYQIINKGNLILCLFDIDVTPRCVGLSEFDGLTSPAYSQFQLKGNDFAKYYYYLLLSIDYDKSFLHLSKNLRSSLTEDDFGFIKTIVPNIDEQQKIANFLDQKVAEIDHILEKTKESIEEYKKYKQSIITEAVTKGLNPDVEMKDSGIEWIGEIPKHWEVKKLKYLAKLNQKVLNENTDDDYFFRYVDISSVTLENGIERYEEINYANAPSRARRVVTKGDVIISTVRTYLKAIASVEDDERVVVSTGFAVLTPYDINSAYLEYFCKCTPFVNTVTAYSTGVSYPAINASSIMEFKAAIPPYVEQQKIADYLETKLDEINSLITQKEQLLSDLESYKKSLIYECVTGKRQIN